MRFKGPRQFYVDFVLFPVVAGIAIDFGGWHTASILFGFVLFTFVEYWMHRLALHGLFYHGNHERHHKHPAGYIVFPAWYTPAVFAGFWLVLPLPVFAGFVLGFVWFIYWHHVLHHFDLARWPSFVRRYAVWHLQHHHDETVNFGITAPVWDYLFGTYRR
jgi:dihydroceramide fatty acyl 2-hydroxylase